MSKISVIWTAGLLVLAGLGGWAASFLPIPLPFMMGSLVITAVVVAFGQAFFPPGYSFPNRIRNGFVALIGVMIGTQVTPEVLGLVGDLPWTLGALVVFVVLAHLNNYLVFAKIGKLPRATAFYAGTPGGLMESILMGETAGADVRIITVQQFLRILLVISLVPAGLSLWLGQPVGSASGTGGGLLPASVPLWEYGMIVAAAAVGLVVAQWLRLPAAQIIGPMMVTGGLSLLGIVSLHLPAWLLAMAQVAVGVSLGMRFKGVSLTLLRRSVGLAVLSVAGMLVLGAVFSEVLTLVTGIPFLHLYISFAPGGVTEMSLIALSLAANPALVSLHHVVRILLTVFEMSFAARLFGFDKA